MIIKSIFTIFICLSFLYGAGTSQISQEKFIPQTQDKKDEKLRLMYQVFVYANDLKNAHKTVKIALKRRPNSLYWHYKMVEVASWLGKGADAVKSMNYIYKFTHSQKMKKRILKSALELYQYKVAAPLIKEETIKNPTPKNIKNLIYVYNQVGKPEVAAKVLEKLAKTKNNKEELLREALKVYILLGWDEDAKRVISKLEKFPKLKIETAREISFFYIPKKKLKKAYDTLLKAWSHNSKVENYFIQISDLGWYLKDFANSAKASKKLMDLKKARLIDYERVINFYKNRSPKLAQKALLESFKKYKKSYLLSSYISLLFSQKKYKKLYKMIKIIEKKPNLSTYFHNPEFYLLKAETLKALKKFDEAEGAYKMAIKLKPTSSELRLALFWFYIDTKNMAKLKEALFEIEDDLNIDESLWLPLAMGHYSLNEVDKAIKYIRLVREKRSSIETDMTYAYLLQLQGNTQGSNKIMQQVFEYLDKKLQKKTKLIKNPQFLAKYLESGINFLNPDRFEELLRLSKKILPKSKYEDLSISFAQKHNIQKSKFIAQKLSTPKPWIDLSIAMAENDYSKAQKLLYKYSMILPPLDSAITAKESGNIALAQTLAFEAEEKNQKNSSIYQLRKEYIQKYANKANLSSGVNRVGDINSFYLRGDILHYLAKGYYLKGAFQTSQNVDKSSKFPNNIPRSDNWIELGVKKMFDRGEVEITGGFRSEADSFFYLLLSGEYRVTDKLSVQSSIKKGYLAPETSYLQFTGKKDEIDLKTTYYYMPSTFVSFSTAYDEYKSQDNKDLGRGYKVRGDLTKEFHRGYPDFRVNIFGEYGDFVESNQKEKGVVDTIANPNDPILPEEYFRTGLSFGVGTSTKDIYTRVWRAYAEFTPYYDWILRRANFSVNTGYGGSLFGQDKLRFDFNYDQSLNGAGDTNYGLNMNYKLLY